MATSNPHDEYAGNPAAPHAIDEAEIMETDLRALREGRLVSRFHITVVTPRSEAAAGMADEIRAPGALGELGLLPGHVPLLAALRAGVLSWRRGGESQVMAVGAGYLEVLGPRVTVLAETCERGAEVDVTTARKDLAEAEQALQRLGGEHEPDEGLRMRLQGDLAWASARLAAAQAAGQANTGIGAG